MEQKHFVAPILASQGSSTGATGKEKSDWYMGYELQKVEGDEVSGERSEQKVKRSEAKVEKQTAQEKQKRKLAKEGLDDAPGPRKRKPERQAQVTQKPVGKTGACRSCVQLLTKVKLFETNIMTAREDSDLDRERNLEAVISQRTCAQG